jgi:hypothetical protein
LRLTPHRLAAVRAVEPETKKFDQTVLFIVTKSALTHRLHDNTSYVLSGSAPWIITNPVVTNVANELHNIAVREFSTTKKSVRHPHGDRFTHSLASSVPSVTPLKPLLLKIVRTPWRALRSVSTNNKSI